MKKKHRNSQKRVYFEDAVYFVSCKTEGNHKYFKERIFCDLFVGEPACRQAGLRICKKLKGFYLYAWVLLYNHFHLLVRPSDKCNISKVMHFLKRHVSRNINIVTGNINNRFTPPEGAVGQPRLREDGANCGVAIQQFDKYILKLKNQFLQNHPNQNPYLKPCLPVGRFQWQKSYHDHYIRDDPDFENHMDYIIWNPDKHKMPDGWPYVFTNEEYRDLTDSPL